MSPDDAVRTGSRSRRRVRSVGFGLVAMWLCVACSGGGIPSTTSSATSSATTGPATSATSTSTSTTSEPSTPVRTTTSAAATHCPVLKPTASTQDPLACTSEALVSAAAAKAGLKRGKDDPNLVPGVKLLDYTRVVLIPVGSIRAVYVFHHANGDVIYAICEGVVGKTLDPVLGVCTDAGSPTATDRAKVRAWVVRAEAMIAKSPRTVPVLTSGKRMFVACQNHQFPKSSDPTNAFEINLIVQHSGLDVDRDYCLRA